MSWQNQEKAETKKLKKIEIEDWFVRNMRAIEAKKQMEHKDLIKEKSLYHANMMKQTAKVDEIDPIFQKAYGVTYNADKSKDV